MLYVHVGKKFNTFQNFQYHVGPRSIAHRQRPETSVARVFTNSVPI